MFFTQLSIGAAFAAPISFAADRVHALSRSGAIAAFVVGTITFGFGGWQLTIVLLAFFSSSIALSRLGRARKKQLTDIGKEGARDAWQVLANGGIATGCSVLVHVHGSIVVARVDSVAWFCAFAGAYAAATADTWGTEIGTLFKRPPRSILTLRPVATGLSGGITLQGTLAEFAGGFLIAIVAVGVLAITPTSPGVHAGAAGVLVAVTLGGIIGALVDSVLGATLQELRRCPACERSCETNPHDCGTPTRRTRGLPGFNNDVVNALATLCGAAVAFALAPR